MMAPPLSEREIVTMLDGTNVTAFTLQEWSQSPIGIVIYLIIGFTALIVVFMIATLTSKRAHAFYDKMCAKASQITGKLSHNKRAPPSDHGAGGIELSNLGQGNGRANVTIMEWAGDQFGATVVRGGGNRGGQFGGDGAEEGDVSMRAVDGDYRRQRLVG
ncbi:MAG: hypothetical protein Q9208_003546 [Pyrenodesmia sp. 3 TL-2023]